MQKGEKPLQDNAGGNQHGAGGPSPKKSPLAESIRIGVPRESRNYCAVEMVVRGSGAPSSGSPSEGGKEKSGLPGVACSNGILQVGNHEVKAGGAGGKEENGQKSTRIIVSGIDGEKAAELDLLPAEEGKILEGETECGVFLTGILGNKTGPKDTTQPHIEQWWIEKNLRELEVAVLKGGQIMGLMGGFRLQYGYANPGRIKVWLKILDADGRIVKGFAAKEGVHPEGLELPGITEKIYVEVITLHKNIDLVEIRAAAEKQLIEK